MLYCLSSVFTKAINPAMVTVLRGIYFPINSTITRVILRFWISFLWSYTQNLFGQWSAVWYLAELSFFFMSTLTKRSVAWQVGLLIYCSYSHLTWRLASCICESHMALWFQFPPSDLVRLCNICNTFFFKSQPLRFESHVLFHCDVCFRDANN